MFASVLEQIEPYVLQLTAAATPWADWAWTTLTEIQQSRTELEWIVIAFSCVIFLDVLNFLG